VPAPEEEEEEVEEAFHLHYANSRVESISNSIICNVFAAKKAGLQQTLKLL